MAAEDEFKSEDLWSFPPFFTCVPGPRAGKRRGCQGSVTRGDLRVNASMCTQSGCLCSTTGAIRGVLCVVFVVVHHVRFVQRYVGAFLRLRALASVTQHFPRRRSTAD